MTERDPVADSPPQQPDLAELERFFAGSPLLSYLEAHPITLIPTARSVSTSEIESLAQSPQQRIFLCDTPLSEIQDRGTLEPFGYLWGRITNIDHHFDVPEMRRYVSSGTLVAKYLERHSACHGDELVVINHKDCDSVLSSLMLRGALPPEERFCTAVIDADHRGTENPIADLLQSLQLWGTSLPARERLAFSVRNLELLLSGSALHPEAARLLAERRRQRSEAEGLVRSGGFTKLGKLAYAVSDSKIDPELFLPSMPDAEVIMFAYPSAENPARYEVRLRVGFNPPPGFSLLNLGIPEKIDPGFGGRWNAGSNRRSKGTELDPLLFAERLATLLNAR